MARRTIDPGDWGDISAKKQSNGRWKATCRYRPWDGGALKPAGAWGATEEESKANLRRNVRDRLAHSDSEHEKITRETRLSVLADLWLEEKALDPGCSAETLKQYRDEIEESADKRGDRAAIKIKPALGDYRWREAKSIVLDRHLKRLLELGYYEKAHRQKVILKGIMGLGARHLNVPNPMDNVARLRRADERTGPRAADGATLTGLRAQMEDWLSGKAIPGTPAYRSGPKRSRLVLDASDLMLATGGRPGEVLAIRKVDCVPLDKDVHWTECRRWRVWFTGTIATDKETGKLYRKPKPKTKNSVGSVVVADFAVPTLIRLLSAAGDDPEAVLLTTRTGGLVSPRKLSGQLRKARGSNYAWVTPKTFRKTVGTRVKRKKGLDAAAEQLRHGSTVITERFYVDDPEDVADYTDALQEGWGGE
jgi:integrase